MPISDDTLRKHGWRPIVSDAHANQLLRRELKHHAKWQQRCRDHQLDCCRLLQIRPGNFYKFMKNAMNYHWSILIWIRPTKNVIE